MPSLMPFASGEDAKEVAVGPGAQFLGAVAVGEQEVRGKMPGCGRSFRCRQSSEERATPKPRFRWRMASNNSDFSCGSFVCGCWVWERRG